MPWIEARLTNNDPWDEFIQTVNAFVGRHLTSNRRFMTLRSSLAVSCSLPAFRPLS